MSAPRVAHFGAGGDAPYDVALRNGGGTLRLVELAAGAGRRVEIARFLAAADAADDSVISRARGPLLDVGCGPGRILHAAIRAGLLALGVDVSHTAVEHARERGLPALQLSVFDVLPQEGSWETLLLLDGNIGIGGDPAVLLARCAQIISSRGTIVVEVDPDPDVDRGFEATVVDEDGRSSSPFPWHDIGAAALRDRVTDTGLRFIEEWAVSDRAFVRLSRAV
ncbi:MULTISPECIES: bifunctional 2-polyprenyl-6-hydroxyphenol methylase/3-demethylubiquinol 3-O-methyltransferase UbiG [unclassified Microbacterium]|uniref:class I SAM-dependent methyltransferase n=1 Tax=unclassified Microbacterium TaxID=2609290 RepID=UPI000EAA81A8|nr:MULTISPECIES: class I SAM-dependent methyltransferase [unclassified Microbacterium]MBT2483753.1 methyltransferase domain-containing protein [Microbacterium sp. ISL-108]RKN66744.1 class I SAM-dependent methyltransferase [Microbacterium sp. CGR2]